MFCWNEDNIAELKRLNAERLSATEIGHRLGISRNAVLGKLLRLRIGKTNGYPTTRAERRPRIRVVKLAPLPAPIALPPLLNARGEPYTIATAEHGQCRYIANDDGLHQICGHPTEEGSGWCAPHRAVCFNLTATARASERARDRQRQHDYEQKRKTA